MFLKNCLPILRRSLAADVCWNRQTQSESVDPWKVSARRIRSLPTVACIVWLRSAIVHSRSKSSNVQRIITIFFSWGDVRLRGMGMGMGVGMGGEWTGRDHKPRNHVATVTSSQNTQEVGRTLETSLFRPKKNETGCRGRLCMPSALPNSRSNDSTAKRRQSYPKPPRCPFFFGPRTSGQSSQGCSQH